MVVSSLVTSKVQISNDEYDKIDGEVIGGELRYMIS